jgi:hypothetical protein
MTLHRKVTSLSAGAAPPFFIKLLDGLFEWVQLDFFLIKIALRSAATSACPTALIKRPKAFCVMLTIICGRPPYKV